MAGKPGESPANAEFQPVQLADLQKIASDLKALQDRANKLTDRMKGQV